MIDQNRKRLLGDAVAGYIDSVDPDRESLWFVAPRVLKHAAFVP